MNCSSDPSYKNKHSQIITFLLVHLKNYQIPLAQEEFFFFNFHKLINLTISEPQFILNNKNGRIKESMLWEKSSQTMLPHINFFNAAQPLSFYDSCIIWNTFIFMSLFLLLSFSFLMARTFYWLIKKVFLELEEKLSNLLFFKTFYVHKSLKRFFSR